MLSFRKAAQFSQDRGGYFCVLLLSLPTEYPIPKQVKPKLNTAISPKISISSALLSLDSLSGFYVIRGAHCIRWTQVLRRPKRSVEHSPSVEGQPPTVMVTLEKILSYSDRNFTQKQPKNLHIHFEASMIKGIYNLYRRGLWISQFFRHSKSILKR